MCWSGCTRRRFGRGLRTWRALCGIDAACRSVRQKGALLVPHVHQLPSAQRARHSGVGEAICRPAKASLNPSLHSPATLQVGPLKPVPEQSHKFRPMHTPLFEQGFEQTGGAAGGLWWAQGVNGLSACVHEASIHVAHVLALADKQGSSQPPACAHRASSTSGQSSLCLRKSTSP